MNDSGAEFRLELERVLNSETLHSSESLRRLLSYLGDKCAAGGGEGLKEFTIGIEAFHKPPDYDPQTDSTVRVLASKLRHKLDDYYRTEGRENPARIELPRGHYLLQFSPANLVQPARPAPRRLQLLWWAVAASLAGLGLWVTLRPAAAPRPDEGWTPELELIWRPYLESKRPVLIALGSPLFTRFATGFFRDPKLNEWEQAGQSARVRGLQRALDSPYATPWYNFTGIGEATGVFLLTKLLAARSADLSLKRSASVSWEDIGAHNLIFLGSSKFNPQLRDIPFEREFVIEGGALKNLRPRPGEPQVFPEVWLPDQTALVEDHALITRLHGLHGQGEITILAASSTNGTWAAVDYVTQPSHARELVARVAVGGKLPEAYQVVVRARFKDQVPIETAYVTHRVLGSGKAPDQNR